MEVGPHEGLPEFCAINCDSVLAVPVAALDPQPAGCLGQTLRGDLDRALRYALDIIF